MRGDQTRSGRANLQLVGCWPRYLCGTAIWSDDMAGSGKASLIDLVAFTEGRAKEPSGALKRTLEAVRQHLGMQVAYVSEFAGSRTVMREVDAPGLEELVEVGS